MPLRPLLAVCAVALAAGCGESRAEKILKEQQALCLGFPAAGTTVVEAERAFSDFSQLLRCLPGQDSGVTTDRLRRLPGDVCDHTSLQICELGWCYFSNDPSACGPNGCFYGCGVRVMPKDDDGNGRIDDDTVICAAQFASEQPAPPFCPFVSGSVERARATREEP
jgi:hypothetical protein